MNKSRKLQLSRIASANKGRKNPKKGQSRITNGADLLPHVDGRSEWMRRFRDVRNLHLNDIGGPDQASEAERSIVRRAAALTVELERLEQQFALSESTDTELIDVYARAAGGLRRLLETVGVARRPRDITPQPMDYARSRRDHSED